MNEPPGGRVSELLAQIAGEQTVEGGTVALIRALKSAKDDPALSTTSERDRYIFALTAIAEFLRKVGTEDLAFWIAELGSALSDLNSGVVRSFLKCPPTHNRSPDASDKWRARAMVAVGVDLLLLAELTREEATKKIEKDFSELKALVNVNRRLGKSALSWSDEFAKNRIKNMEAKRVYGELKTWIAVSNIDPTTALGAAVEILQGAISEIPSVRS
jgi:hypothetical protein